MMRVALERSMYSRHFSDHAHDGDPQTDVPTHNPDPASIFANGTVRTVVVQNLVELNINADVAVGLLRVRRHPLETVVRAEFPKGLGTWERHEALARWIDTHELVGSYHHGPHWFSKCVRAMALRGDEAFSENDELLWLRVAYEVNLALTKLLRMEDFLTEARAIADAWTSLLWPVRSAAEWRFAPFVRETFAARLGLPDPEAARHFYQAFLRDLARPKPERSMPDAELDVRSFRVEMERRFRPWIAGTWPDGSDDRIRAILLSRAWEGQETAEIRYLCREPQEIRRMSMAQIERERALISALGDDREARQRALTNIHTWLAQTHPELVDLVRPLHPRP